MAIALALVGARPVKEATGRVVKYELVPLSELQRPRIDVLASLSGIFRDSFANVVDLLDDLFETAAAAEVGEGSCVRYLLWSLSTELVVFDFFSFLGVSFANFLRWKQKDSSGGQDRGCGTRVQWYHSLYLVSCVLRIVLCRVCCVLRFVSCILYLVSWGCVPTLTRPSSLVLNLMTPRIHPLKDKAKL